MAEKKRGPGRPKGSKNKRKTGDETMAVKPQTGSGAKKSGSNSNRSGSTTKRTDTRNSTKKDDPKKKGSKKPGRKSENHYEKQFEEQLPKEPVVDSAVRQSIAAIVLLAIGAFLVISIQTGFAGMLGEAIGHFFKGLFGLGAYILPYILIIYGILMFAKVSAPFRGRTVVIITILFLMVDIINAGRFAANMKYGILGISEVYKEGISLKGGGVFGMYAGSGLYQLVGTAGLYLITGVVVVICILLLINTPLSRILEDGRTRRLERRAKREAKIEEREKADMKAAENAMAAKAESDLHSFAGEQPFSRKQPHAGKQSFAQRLMIDKRDIDDQEYKTGTGQSGTGQSGTGQNGPEQAAHSAQTTKAPAHIAGLDANKRKILELVKSENRFGSDISKSKKSGPDIHISGEDQKTDGAKGVGSSFGSFGNGDSSEGGGRSADFDGFVEDSKVLGKEGPTKTEDDFVGFKTESTPVEGGFTAAGTMIGGASAATAASTTESSEGAVNVTPKKRGRYKLPPLDLLNPVPAPTRETGLKEDLTDRASMLEQTLSSFNVDAKVVNVISGPSVTRYEIEPARGVKVQSITRLADDIALNMRAKSIRIEAPIPGKAAVGIEIENESRQMVGFREIVGSSEFRNHKSKLAFSVGRDIGGKPVVADLGKMPHLLIAGATGSGKSVCINTIIGSILYKARPEEVKLVLIDPKMVELGNYNGIPHLLIPVVTDSSKAAAALNWAVSEMTDRYKKFARTGVRDIGAFNKIMRDRGEKEEILPQIVVIIDELADLMMVASSQVEDSICRLAQLARAAGMHLVIATQRPSVDVITGLIKANVPSRIAFMVSSQIDSRTIIDMPGAEKLVGNGDMLFKPQDLNKPKRIQGPFIDDGEVERVIEYVKNQAGEAEYNEEVIEHIEKGNSYSGEDEGDELMMDAIETVVSAGQASVSMLQRRFRIGYNRAARMIDMMESRGIIGPQDGSRPRQVLMTEAELENMKENL